MTLSDTPGTPRTSADVGPLYLVDGYNLLHALILQGKKTPSWWSREHQERVVRYVEGLAHGDAVIVFDASRASELAPSTGPVSVEFAADADQRIVELTSELASLRRVVVVSADRSLTDRARFRGATRCSPWAFRQLLSAG